jgi:predicted RND superfamily exporter protein
MKKHINLLIQRKDYKKKERFFYWFRKVTFALGFITILILLAILINNQKVKNQYASLLSKKEAILQELSRKKEIEKQVVYVNEKSNFLDKVLNEDVNFLPYYRALKAYLPISTSSADIGSIKYDKAKRVEFLLNFSNYNDLYDSLSNFESEEFLKLFEELTLNSVNLSETKAKNYQLSLKGKFKDITKDLTPDKL